MPRANESSFLSKVWEESAKCFCGSNDHRHPASCHCRAHRGHQSNWLRYWLSWWWPNHPRAAPASFSVHTLSLKSVRPRDEIALIILLSQLILLRRRRYRELPNLSIQPLAGVIDSLNRCPMPTAVIQIRLTSIRQMTKRRTMRAVARTAHERRIR